MQRPLLPEVFRAGTFVTEKELGGKPICMTWDERGRLWASITVDCPNELKPRGQGRARIVCCVDADGDGRADTGTTFAGDPSIPTRILCAGRAGRVRQNPDVYEAARGWAPSPVLGGIAGGPKFHASNDKFRPVDHHGAATAAAGDTFYTARADPPEY